MNKLVLDEAETTGKEGKTAADWKKIPDTQWQREARPLRRPNRAKLSVCLCETASSLSGEPYSRSHFPI